MDAVLRTLNATQIMEGVDPLIFADETDRLLAHMYSSPHFLSDFKLLPPSANACLSRSPGLRELPLLFKLEDDSVQVLNEQMQMSAAEVDAFCSGMFEAYPQVTRVVFPVLAPSGPLRQPSSQVKVTQDLMLTLPNSAQQYEQALGRATRSALKRTLHKLERDFPGLRIEVLTPGMNDARLLKMLDRVLGLNQTRMALRGQTSKVDPAQAQAVRLALLRCGMLVLLLCGDDLVAGTINFRFGANSFLYLLAHDSRFNRYSPGMLCCYLTVLECISRGEAEYHFLWGQYEYKYRLLATPRELVRLTVYRSARDCQHATAFGLTVACSNLRYEWRNRLALCALGRGGNGTVDRLLRVTLSSLKKMKRLVLDLKRQRANLLAGLFRQTRGLARTSPPRHDSTRQSAG